MSEFCFVKNASRLKASEERITLRVSFIKLFSLSDVLKRHDHHVELCHFITVVSYLLQFIISLKKKSGMRVPKSTYVHYGATEKEERSNMIKLDYDLI
jgi:hypothetical protein